MDMSMSFGFPCLFHLLTGLYCPGCGGTRAVTYLLRGQIIMSFQYHPLVLYGFVVFAAELISYGLARIKNNPALYIGHCHALVNLGIGITFVNWVFKNYMLLIKGIDLLP